MPSSFAATFWQRRIFHHVGPCHRFGSAYPMMPLFSIANRIRTRPSSASLRENGSSMEADPRAHFAGLAAHLDRLLPALKRSTGTLHAHPESSMQEVCTSGIVTDRVRSAASGAPREPEIKPLDRYTAVRNDPDAAQRVMNAFARHFAPPYSGLSAASITSCMSRPGRPGARGTFPPTTIHDSLR
jgi:hypothetical protein